MSPFLCPHCFQFGEALFACPGCWEDTGTLRVRLNVGDLQACPCCYDALYSEDEIDHLAYCQHCHQVSDALLHHHREVRLVGMAGTHGLEPARRFLVQQRKEEGPVRLMHERQATYLLDIATAASGAAPAGSMHALQYLEALWLDAADLQALELGRIVDGFIRQARINGGRRRTFPVLIRQASLPGGVLNVLRSRLVNLRYDVPLSEVLAAEREWSMEALSSARERPRVLATVHEGDFRTLAALLPDERVRRLHLGITGAEVSGRLTFIVDATRLPHIRLERVAPIQQAADAIWMERLPVAEPPARFVERLCLLLGRTMAARRRIHVLIGQKEADEEQHALLTESFPNVYWGVTPAEAFSAGQ